VSFAVLIGIPSSTKASKSSPRPSSFSPVSLEVTSPFVLSLENSGFGVVGFPNGVPPVTTLSGSVLKVKPDSNSYSIRCIIISPFLNTEYTIRCF